MFFFLLFFSALSPELRAYEAVAVREPGTIRGEVKFPGEPPPRGMYATRGDKACPHGIVQNHLLVKTENRGLANALLILRIRKGKPVKLRTAKLDNKSCTFQPRVQWLPKAGNLLLTNSDQTSHIVHAYRDTATVFEVPLEAGDKPVRRPLVDEGFYKINCDRHLWSRAWIYVSQHPYIAVSDADGRFQISDVPPGTYELRAWHEGWQEKGTEVTGQLLFEAMEQVLRVKVRPRETTEVLVDALEPAFLYAQ